MLEDNILLFSSWPLSYAETEATLVGEATKTKTHPYKKVEYKCQWLQTIGEDGFFNSSAGKLLKQMNQPINKKIKHSEKIIQNWYNLWFLNVQFIKTWDVQANPEGVTHSSHGTVKAVGQVFLEAVS